MVQTSHQPTDLTRCPAARARTPVGFAAWAGALAVAYFVTGKLGLMLPTVGASVTLLWPPTGLAVFALLCWGRRYWPGVAAGALAVNLTLAPAWVAVGIAVGNTLAPLLAAAALARFGYHGVFASRRDVIVFATAGAAAPMLVSAVNGPLWLALAGAIDWGGWGRAAFIWWAGDGAGVMVFAPVLFGLRAEVSRWKRTGMPVGAAVWLLVIAGVTAAAFVPHGPLDTVSRPVGLVPLLLLAWACIGHRGWVASVGVAVVCVVAVCGTAAGGGPFGASPPDQQLFQVWVYVLLVALVTVTVSAVLNERDGVERVLAAREAEYRALVEGNPALISRYTRDGRLTFANDTFCRFAGRPRDELVGRPLDSLIKGPSKGAVVDLFARFERDGTPITFCGPFADHTGAERWVEFKGRSHGDEVQVVGLDVTDRRALEARVTQAQKLESLGAIAGGVAHDFNNLLTGVLGHADLAAAGVPPDSPERAHLTAVMEAAGRAADLSRQLLAYAGKGRLLVRPVDANAAADRAVDLAAAGVPPAVTVRRRFDPHLPRIDADETQVQQVVLNLLRNAADAVGKDGRIEVSTGVQVVGVGATDHAGGDGQPLAPGRYVRVAVADTGCGIPADLLPRVFDPFVTTKFMGRGLGLAAVQGIVRAHRGGVRVDTAAGRGTTVAVLFPVSTTPPGRSGISARDTTVEPPSTDRRRTVLLADDEETIRELTSQMLQQLGWEVVTATDGRDAVTRFRRHADQIRFVVLDLTMPEMDGWQAMAALRRDRPDLPVLLCTGHNEDSVPMPDGRTTGLLLKPFRVAELRQAVHRLLAPAAAPAVTAAR